MGLDHTLYDQVNLIVYLKNCLKQYQINDKLILSEKENKQKLVNIHW